MRLTLLIISLALNALLAVACLRSKDVDSLAKQPATPKTKVLTRTVVQEVAAPAGTNPVQSVPEDPFHWSAIQSTNFVEYARSLREIGCPNQTIREIILGEINDWTLAQRRAIIAPYAPRFWEFAAKGDMEIPKELKQPLADLKKTRQKLINEALKSFPKTDSPPKSQPKDDETLAMLPAEKLEQIRALELKFAALQKEVGKDQKLKAEDRQKRMQNLQKQFEKEKLELMSPEELAEHKVRQESWVFQDMYGFKADQDEMRRIAEVYARQTSLANKPNKKVSNEDRKAAENQRDEELKALLGETRFTEFKRGSDNSYRLLWQIAQAHKLPEEAANKAYEIQVASREQIEAVDMHPSMTPEQKAASLQELHDSVEDATVAILGEKAARFYQRKFPSR